MRGKIRTLGKLLWQTIGACQQHNTPMLAAGLSFYSLLSLTPAVWVITAVAGVWVGHETARQGVIQWTTKMVGPAPSAFMESVLTRAETPGYLATAFGLLSLLFGTSLAFEALYESLNLIWSVPPRTAGRMILGYFIKRLLAFVLVLLVGALMLASLLLTTIVSTLGEIGGYFFAVPPALIETINSGIAMALVMLLFVVIYRILHDTRIAWHDVWIGALVTAGLFALGKTLLALLLTSAITSSYGTAGSLVVLLLWVYYSAQIFLFGAEFTEVYSRTRKSPPSLAPSPERKPRPKE